MKSKLKQYGITPQDPSRWVAVGDASRVIIFEKRRKVPLKPVQSFSNPCAHLKLTEFESDEPGRTFERHNASSKGGTSHGYAPKSDPKERATESFVKTVGEFLNQAFTEGRYDHLILVGGDRLRGSLFSNLNKQAQASVTKVQDADLAFVSGPELEERVEKILNPA